MLHKQSCHNLTWDRRYSQGCTIHGQLGRAEFYSLQRNGSMVLSTGSEPEYNFHPCPFSDPPPPYFIFPILIYLANLEDGEGERESGWEWRMNVNRGEGSTQVIQGPHVAALLRKLSRQPNALLFQKGAGSSNITGK